MLPTRCCRNRTAGQCLRWKEQFVPGLAHGQRETVGMAVAGRSRPEISNVAPDTIGQLPQPFGHGRAGVVDQFAHHRFDRRGAVSTNHLEHARAGRVDSSQLGAEVKPEQIGDA